MSLHSTERSTKENVAETSALRRCVHFSVCAQDRLVMAKFGERLGSKDLEDYAMRLRKHPDFDPEFSEIADIRDVEELRLTAQDMIVLADKVDPFSHESDRAFVVRTSTQAHAARMHKILRTQRNIEIFHSVVEAEQWIEDRRSQT